MCATLSTIALSILHSNGDDENSLSSEKCFAIGNVKTRDVSGINRIEKFFEIHLDRKERKSLRNKSKWRGMKVRWRFCGLLEGEKFLENFHFCGSRKLFLNERKIFWEK